MNFGTSTTQNNMGGVFDLSNPSSTNVLKGSTIAGPTIFNLNGAGGAGSGSGIKGATMFDAASLAAGYDANNRQRYVDQATTNAKQQINAQVGAAQRTAAMQGRKSITTPTQMIDAAAEVAAAGTQGGWKADEDSFNKRMQVANLAQQGNMFNLQSANNWNNANYQQGMLGVAQQQANNQTNSINRSLNTQNQEVQGYNSYNQSMGTNPYGLTNYSGTGNTSRSQIGGSLGTDMGNAYSAVL